MYKYIDRKLIKILVLFYTATSLLSFIKKIYLKLNVAEYEFYGWNKLFIEGFLLDWLIVIFSMLVVAITTKMMITKKIKLRYIISIHLFFSFLIGIIIYLILSLFYLLTRQINRFDINLENGMSWIISVADLNFLIYSSMIFIVYFYYYFEKTQKVELEKSQLSNQLTNAKMNVLKYQLHPHFLFNTLNSISSLIKSNSQLAQDTIADFGDLLRDLLLLKNTNLITIEEEVKISKRYLDIMTLRFSDHLKVSIDIDKSMDHLLIPTLILLPIIENSIKHGYSYNRTHLTIDLSIKSLKNKVKIQIKNNGAPLKKTKRKYGMGLQNTLDRLKLLYENNYKYHMKNLRKKEGVITTIIIPKTTTNC